MARLYFLQDVMAHLLDVSDLSNTTSDRRRALRSAIWGYEQATTRHQWEFYNTQEVFTLNAQWSGDGASIAISDAGVIFLIGDVFPDWMEEASFVAGDEMYRVGSRDSDQTVTLENWRGTTEGLGDLTSWRFIHNRHVLAEEPKQLYDIWDETNDCGMVFVEQQQFRDQDRWQVETGGIPQIATIRSKNMNGMMRYELLIAPFSETEITLDVAFIRRPKQPRWNWHAGLISSTGGVVTTANKLPMAGNADFTGSWLRVSEAGGDAAAELDYGVWESHPAQYEEPIISVSGSNGLVVATTMPDVLDVGACVSDYLDIPDFLFTSVLMYAEANMQRIAHGDLQKYAMLMAAGDDQMRTAMEQGPLTKQRWGGSKQRVGHLESMVGHYIVEV